MISKIFISYSDLDKHKMRHLQRLIILEKDLEPIIIADYKRSLVQLSDKVKKGMLDSKYFIPIITRQSIYTQWLNQEIGFAIAKNNRRILPIIESQVINDLKGFIHKNVDLPFIFDGFPDNKRLESFRFVSTAKELVAFIVEDINKNNPSIQFKPGMVSIVNRKPQYTL